MRGNGLACALLALAFAFAPPARAQDSSKAWVATHYVAGIVGTVVGDTEFAGKASQFGLEGTLRLVFKPASQAFEIVTEHLAFVPSSGWTSGELMRDRETRDVKQSFEKDIRETIERALRRYLKPDAIDPSWVVELRFVYGYVLR
jgi:hypothetical protein